MADLPNCSILDCTQKVSKSGFLLCHSHWLEQNKKSNKSDSTAPMPIALEVKEAKSGLINSTQLGEYFSISSKKLNRVLAELGWIESLRKGWVATAQGKQLRAELREHHQTGIPYVLWPEAIKTSRILKNSINEMQGLKEPTPSEPEVSPIVETLQISEKQANARSKLDKFKPTHRAMDGHWVRSKAEGLIDNWLYMSGIAHAYERSLPVEEELYCDFYIPAGKVYIEYWGMENDSKYKVRKELKRQIYQKYHFNLIELSDEHIQNLDDYLPKMLLKFNVVIE